MYMHTHARFCEPHRCFSLLSPLNITYSFFCLSALSPFPPCCRVSSSFPSSSTPQAQGHPCPSLLPSFRLSSACPPLLLSVVCSVAAVCLLLCPRPRGLFRPAFCVRAPEAPRRPSVCPAVCLLAPAVTRPSSGAKRCDSVGRCTVYMSPAFCPLVRHVLPCVLLSVPWLPAVCPCACAAACCRLVVTIACTPQYPGRRRCGAASGV